MAPQFAGRVPDERAVRGSSPLAKEFLLYFSFLFAQTKAAATCSHGLPFTVKTRN